MSIPRVIKVERTYATFEHLWENLQGSPNITAAATTFAPAQMEKLKIACAGDCPVGKEFLSHGTVEHSAKEYVRGEITTNTVEGYYSIFKRGMKGVYQHCAEKHLHRYLVEFDFSYSHRVAIGYDDSARAAQALKGIVGKRLTYRAADNAARV